MSSLLALPIHTAEQPATQSSVDLLSTTVRPSNCMLESQTSIVLSSFTPSDTFETSASTSWFTGFTPHNVHQSSRVLSSIKGSSLFTSSYSVSKKSTEANEADSCPGTIKRKAILDDFCASDLSAELHSSLKMEESRFLQVAELAKSSDSDDVQAYWEMTDKTSLLLDWFSAQSAETQDGFFDSYDQEFIDELKIFQSYSRGISDLKPVELLGDQWKEGVAPKSDSFEDRFVPPAPVADAGRRINPLPFTTVSGTEDICNLLSEAEAHGIEQSKGGLSSIVNIIIEGYIAPSKVFGVSQVCTGPMTRDLDPSMSAGRHGPFYILMNPTYAKERPDTSRGLSCDNHHAYLVPTSEDARVLRAGLSQAAEMGIITEDHASACSDKILTYENLLSPKSAPHPIAMAVLEHNQAL